MQFSAPVRPRLGCYQEIDQNKTTYLTTFFSRTSLLGNSARCWQVAIPPSVTLLGTGPGWAKGSCLPVGLGRLRVWVLGRAQPLVRAALPRLLAETLSAPGRVTTRVSSHPPQAVSSQAKSANLTIGRKVMGQLPLLAPRLSPLRSTHKLTPLEVLHRRLSLLKGFKCSRLWPTSRWAGGGCQSRSPRSRCWSLCRSSISDGHAQPFDLAPPRKQQ